ncbi:membrane anchor protein YbhG [Klebsiella pneumoniae]|nr:membrane anchor protein YbhG [Klebsiella pneumoniae]
MLTRKTSARRSRDKKCCSIPDSRPDKPYHGKIGFVSPSAEFTPKTVETPDLRTDLVYRLRIVVTDADGALRQGMPVTISFSHGNGHE